MEKIILNEKLKTSFIKAGWYENRDISNRYLKVKDLKHFPETIRNFLFEYGDLINDWEMLFLESIDFSLIISDEIFIKYYKVILKP